MSGVTSCKHCGCSEIDTDPARGDAVCTSCGYVLEESIIVSEITFEEDGHGGASAVGQFVSSESRGGGVLSGTGAGFHTGVAKESREITLRTGKKKIQEVAQILRLNQHCIDVAYNFFKMALHKQLTKGRRHALTIAACVYMTCRIEETPHLLIDFSDVVQMDIYALGRAYNQISRALFINIPAVDPCLYIIRFAHKFNLGSKTHDVSMTALRLVQRMKRDWIHLGRRPSGLCGAALLIAARLHNFSRTVQDVIKIVKVHETTLRKRLVEFGETASSSLTLDEFMSVDLEEEHDPPSFKAARVKDREQLQKLLDDDVGQEFLELQKKIDQELDKRKSKCALDQSSPILDATESRLEKFVSREAEDTTKFIVESTVSAINNIIDLDEPVKSTDDPEETDPSVLTEVNNSEDRGETIVGPLKSASDAAMTICDIDRILMPPPRATDGKPESESNMEISEEDDPIEMEQVTEEDLLEGIDDDEINSYIMNPTEVRSKTILWEQINADYIMEQELKKSQNIPSRKEAKAERQKQKKKNQKKAIEGASTFQAKTANEAIKIMLMEKKISNKINYEVLKNLSSKSPDFFGYSGGSGTPTASTSNLSTPVAEQVTVIESGPVIPPRNLKRQLGKSSDSESISTKKSKSSKKVKLEASTEEQKSEKECKVKTEGQEKKAKVLSTTSDVETVTLDEVVIESGPVRPVQYTDDDHDSEEEEEAISARQLLTKFRGGEDDDDDYYD